MKKRPGKLSLLMQLYYVCCWLVSMYACMSICLYVCKTHPGAYCHMCKGPPHIAIMTALSKCNLRNVENLSLAESNELIRYDFACVFYLYIDLVSTT